MSFRSKVLASAAAAPLALACSPFDGTGCTPTPGRKGPHCGTSDVQTLVIGDSYAEFSSSYGGSTSESYFSTYCGGDDLGNVCNMGISGTLSTSYPEIKMPDNWTWSYVDDDNEGFISKAFAEVASSTTLKRVIYYISGNDYMYRSCASGTQDVKGMVETSLSMVVNATEARGLEAKDITMIAYANPQAHFAAATASVDVTVPDDYVATEDHFSAQNIIQSTSGLGDDFVSQRVSAIKLAGRDETAKTFDEFDDRYGVRDYCKKDGGKKCQGATFTLAGGICYQKSGDIKDTMKKIIDGIKAACDDYKVNFVDVSDIVNYEELGHSISGTNEWSPTDSGDQNGTGYHLDDIHLNGRGNCAVAQSSQFKDKLGLTCKYSVDCTQKGNPDEIPTTTAALR